MERSSYMIIPRLLAGPPELRRDALISLLLILLLLLFPQLPERERDIWEWPRLLLRNAVPPAQRKGFLLLILVLLSIGCWLEESPTPQLSFQDPPHWLFELLLLLLFQESPLFELFHESPWPPHWFGESRNVFCQTLMNLTRLRLGCEYLK